MRGTVLQKRKLPDHLKGDDQIENKTHTDEQHVSPGKRRPNYFGQEIKCMNTQYSRHYKEESQYGRNKVQIQLWKRACGAERMNERQYDRYPAKETDVKNKSKITLPYLIGGFMKNK